MNDMNLANKIGLRSKRIRESQGMTLQALADMVNTSAANISKFEKQGISNIEWITAISRALGQDLLKDEVDEEGTVGEIGKEILIKLIENKGLLSYRDVVANMHGMSEDRVSNEIFKLTRIGMCVREQYKDFLNKQQDKIFITAKGLITCYNAITNPLIEARISPIISEVNTYENLLKGDAELGIENANSFQEYIELRPFEKLIRNLPYTDSLYRADFITWLKKKYTTGYDKFTTSKFVDDFIPAESFIYDLYYRMAVGISDDELLFKFSSNYLHEKYACDFYFDPNDPEQIRLEEIEKKLGIESFGEQLINSFPDFIKDSLAAEFRERFGFEKAEEKKKTSRKLDLSILSDEDRVFYQDYQQAVRDELEFEEFLNMSVEERYNKNMSQKKSEGIDSPYPYDWYKDEEVIEFVKDNFKEASEGNEISVDKQLAKIIEMKPEVLDYYNKNVFSTFPSEALHYIRDIYKIE